MIGGVKGFFPKNNLSFRQAAAKAKRQAKAKAKASATSRAKAKAKPKAKAAAALPTCGTKRRLQLKTVSELVKKMKRQDGNHDNQEEERKELAPPDPDTTAVERSAVSAGRAVAVMAEEERPDSQGPGEWKCRPHHHHHQIGHHHQHQQPMVQKPSQALRAPPLHHLLLKIQRQQLQVRSRLTVRFRVKKMLKSLSLKEQNSSHLAVSSCTLVS